MLNLFQYFSSELSKYILLVIRWGAWGAEPAGRVDVLSRRCLGLIERNKWTAHGIADELDRRTLLAAPAAGHCQFTHAASPWN
jgi:hypothetical protein